jgi:hypothetical protein
MPDEVDPDCHYIERRSALGFPSGVFSYLGLMPLEKASGSDGGFAFAVLYERS